MNHFKRVLYLYSVLFFIVTGNAMAQNSSNRGIDFWVAYAGHIDGLGSRLTLFITSQNKAIVNINAGGVNLPPVTVLANQAVPVYIDPNIYNNTYVGGSDIVYQDRGIHVTSDVPIVLYSHISRSARSAATLVLPTKALGNEYIAMAYDQVPVSNNNFRVSQFTLVGVEDSTQIEISPVATVYNSNRVGTTPFQVRLDKGDIYQYQSTTDVTGVRIKTIGNCKPVAAFSGSTQNGFCTNNAGTTQDNLYQQLFPISAWGKNYVTAPFYNAQNGAQDIIRIFVNEDNTEVSVNGSTTQVGNIQLQNPYAKGSIITFYGSTAFVIKGSKPISVAQLQVSQSCNPNNTGTVRFPGDPEMTILNPVEQTLSDITLYSAVSVPVVAPTNIIAHYINIILKTVDVPSLRVDNAIPNGSFVTIDNEYSYITVDVTSSSATNPAHRIVCSGGFVAIAYGYGNIESYAYLAGSDLKNLNANISFFPKGSSNATSNLCIGEDYQVQLKLPYQTNKIIWDFKNGLKRDTIFSVTPSQIETVNGITSYFYDYQINASEITTSGMYNLKATVLNPAPASCSAEEEIATEFEVFNPPMASFIYNNKLCPESTIDFTPITDGRGNTVNKWLWDFGDGNISTLQNPNHAYATPGDKIVSLSVAVDKGCWSEVFKDTISINPFPNPDFNFSSTACVNKEIQFSDISTATEQTITSWSWNFGDGNTSTLQNPKHVFTTVGDFTVTLTITTNNACTKAISKVIKINPLPITDFITPDFCLNDAIATFINTSTIADNSNMSYVWDFGDPTSGSLNTSIQKDGVHNYSAQGVYRVKLTATSTITGCQTVLEKDFIVNGSTPLARFNVLNENNLCINQEVIIEDLASVDFGEITKIEWYWDYDQNPALKLVDESPELRNTSLKRQYRFNYPIFHTPLTKQVKIRMVVYSGISCSSYLDKIITLKAVPQVNFTLPSTCLPQGKATFTNNTTINGVDDPAITYVWNFGDGNTSTQKNPIHPYTAAGNYEVILTATFNGCSKSDTLNFNVIAAIPEVNFEVLNVHNLCSNQPVILKDLSTISFGSITKIEWFFNETSGSSNPNYYQVVNAPVSGAEYSFIFPLFHSPLTKIITAKLKVYSETCVSEKIMSITLKAVPQISFTPIPEVCQEQANFRITQARELSGFTGSATFTGRGVTADGMFSPSSAGPGEHQITYTFTGVNGCIEVLSQSIKVNPTPIISAGENQTILIGGNAILNAVASGEGLTYSWSPATGLSNPSVLNPVANPTDDITYTLTVNSATGCVATDDVFVKVLQKPEIPNVFTPNGDGTNDRWEIKYLDSYPSVNVNVYNRYGKVVYQSDNYNQAWDGRFNGEDLPVGAYYYIITIEERNLKYSGSVMIVR
ncbi:T9SS C-terminal target domain-containing protein [Pedobacter glucosidilyticus]|uniref:T9SS C-terminal target domain-containing protein n=1 Tax=Pedobacter glucosidilyticus TaxID=1122941 RepID=UPI000479105A|nr:T9SS C-terminal target domain-containing protein [Pedobacter glucosidilyticus]